MNRIRDYIDSGKEWISFLLVFSFGSMWFGYLFSQQSIVGW